jgi:hypothetical protein
MKPALMAKPKAILGAQSNAVYDGHSCMAGQGGGGVTISSLLNAMPTLGGGTWTNVAIAGQGWPEMIANPTDVDSAWVAGKTNVLLLWEHVNTMYFHGYTPQQTADSMRQYIKERRALHPWLVVLLSAYASQPSSNSYWTRQGVLEAGLVVDSIIAANPAYYGVDMLVNLREKGSIFDMPDWTDASFAAMGDVWFEPLGGVLHLNPNGYAAVARLVEKRLQNLRGIPHQ